MKKLKFTNGDQMDAIGLGTWKSEKGAVTKAVKIALENGYRHIDCASTYGNEAEVGEAFKEVFEGNTVKRDDVWVTSKLWNNAHKKEDVIPALKNTLNDLNLEYLDLYLMHWPVAIKPEVGFPEKAEDFLSLDEVPLIETWNEMVKAKEQGLVKHIGVSNFSIPKLKGLMEETDHTPEMNQVELHPYLQQNELLEFCSRNQINVTAYSPLGSGDRPDRMKAADEPSLLENPVIQRIAKKHGANEGQILIKWSEQRGTGVIPKSTNKERIIGNLASAGFQLDEDDLKEIAELDEHFRYVTGKFFEMEGNSYENIYDD
ncbi:aldo/keto reductase [Christiangramia flava]|uniref:Aldo-keto reductase family 1 member B10 n=1 Tax=Christiangramia flava JLT2011 TaxID=1229726 RepID=A0A1L7I9S5_9FLAO|nr:aldo/keto reductase [Christiangramia flava]APU70330.1 Aldo-keto reductase family 1 member B10 [Christiangramia flava JLT2011]OSS37574.1 aldehyde reductase [Christiangramia flava JLT2011]